MGQGTTELPATFGSLPLRWAIIDYENPRPGSITTEVRFSPGPLGIRGHACGGDSGSMAACVPRRTDESRPSNWVQTGVVFAGMHTQACATDRLDRGEETEGQLSAEARADIARREGAEYRSTLNPVTPWTRLQPPVPLCRAFRDSLKQQGLRLDQNNTGAVREQEVRWWLSVIGRHGFGYFLDSWGVKTNRAARRLGLAGDRPLPSAVADLDPELTEFLAGRDADTTKAILSQWLPRVLEMYRYRYRRGPAHHTTEADVRNVSTTGRRTRRSLLRRHGRRLPHQDKNETRVISLLTAEILKSFGNTSTSTGATGAAGTQGCSSVSVQTASGGDPETLSNTNLLEQGFQVSLNGKQYPWEAVPAAAGLPAASAASIVRMQVLRSVAACYAEALSATQADDPALESWSVGELTDVDAVIDAAFADKYGVSPAEAAAAQEHAEREQRDAELERGRREREAFENAADDPHLFHDIVAALAREQLGSIAPPLTDACPDVLLYAPEEKTPLVCGNGCVLGIILLGVGGVGLAFHRFVASVCDSSPNSSESQAGSEELQLAVGGNNAPRASTSLQDGATPVPAAFVEGALDVAHSE